MTGTSLVVFGCVFGERGHFTHTHGCQRHPQHGLGRAVKEHKPFFGCLRILCVNYREDAIQNAMGGLDGFPENGSSGGGSR